MFPHSYSIFGLSAKWSCYFSDISKAVIPNSASWQGATSSLFLAVTHRLLQKFLNSATFNDNQTAKQNCHINFKLFNSHVFNTDFSSLYTKMWHTSTLYYYGWWQQFLTFVFHNYCHLIITYFEHYNRKWDKESGVLDRMVIHILWKCYDTTHPETEHLIA